MQISDLQILRKFELKYPKNLPIRYLSINFLRNKLIDVREMIGRLQLNYFVIGETKLDSSFPSAHFHIGDYETRNRKDRNKSGGGLIEFTKKGIITKRHKDLKTNLSETIYNLSARRQWCRSGIFIVNFEHITHLVLVLLLLTLSR